MGYHGNLSSKTCIIDAKYCLKIANTAYLEMADLLDMDRESSLGAPFNSDEELRKPPEVRELHGSVRFKALAASRTKACDVYSVAMMFFEILTSRPVEEALIMAPDARRSFHPEVEELDMPVQLKTLLTTCLRGHPDARPTAKQFIQQFLGIQKRKTNIVEHILHRLEEQLDDLECAIVERSAELEKEIARADSILKEILPT